MQGNRSRVVILAALITVTAIAVAQDKKPLSPPGQASLKFADGHTVTIDYSRPSMRNRKIFGGLVPFDQVWRTGANAATSLKTDVDLNIGGTSVPAGSYTIYTLPGMSNWQLIVNKETGQWGLTYNPKMDLGRVKMTMSKPASTIEMYKMTLSSTGPKTGLLRMEWEHHIATVPITVK